MFPWSRYWRRAGVVFAVALVLSLVLLALFNSGRLGFASVLVAIVDSVVLAVVVAFPLTQTVNRGPRR